MSRYSRKHRIPIAIIASMKTMPPATVIAIAKAIAGTATRIRRVVSPPPLRGAEGSGPGLRLGRLRLEHLFFEEVAHARIPSSPPEAPLTLRVGLERALERRPVEV